MLSRLHLRGPVNARAVVATEPGAGMGGVAPYALDQGKAERLWEETIRLLGA